MVYDSSILLLHPVLPKAAAADALVSHGSAASISTATMQQLILRAQNVCLLLQL
jgi:hypothetical protein